jgi:predicted transcriptional regulator
MLDSPKVNNEIFNNFLMEHKFEFCNMINSTLDTIEKEHEYYFMKRGSLIFIEKLLLTPTFNKFKYFYTNYPDNLKSVMKQLNNRNTKIVQQALEVLYQFFLDLENKDRAIKLLLHANDNNFHKFFEKHKDIIQEKDLIEKKEYILEGLKQLDTLLLDK